MSQRPGQKEQKNWGNRLNEIVKSAKQNLAEGAVTENYKANREEMIDLLNRALSSEWIAFLQYKHHWFMATDIHSAEIASIFNEHAMEELEHADKIGARIQLLGGVPVDKPEDFYNHFPLKVEYGHDLRNMMELDLVAERAVVSFYEDIVRFAGLDDNVTREMFEEILEVEQEHANEWADLLFQFDASTNKEIESLHRQRVEAAVGQR